MVLNPNHSAILCPVSSPERPSATLSTPHATGSAATPAGAPCPPYDNPYPPRCLALRCARKPCAVLTRPALVPAALPCDALRTTSRERGGAECPPRSRALRCARQPCAVLTRPSCTQRCRAARPSATPFPCLRTQLPPHPVPAHHTANSRLHVHVS